MTHKQKQFVKEYIKTGNATEAASRVYKTKNRNTAKSIGSENLTKLDLMEVMDKTGISDNYLMEILKRGLEAKRQIVTGNKKVQIFEDYNNQSKFLAIALKLKGYLSLTDKNQEPIVVYKNPYEDKSIEELQKIVDDLESEEEIRNRCAVKNQNTTLSNEIKNDKTPEVFSISNQH